MKAVFLCLSAENIKRAYSKATVDRLRKHTELADFTVNSLTLGAHADYLSECEVVFSTWGMPPLTKKQIEKYFPKLKAIFYAAGTVQNFARPFIERGVRVYSAWRANAVPVAEYTVAQIILSNKGYFQSSSKCRNNQVSAKHISDKHCGNFDFVLGVCGAGCIGSLVCERLRGMRCRILIFDKYISDERIKLLGAERAQTLEEIFSESDVITNHLADKDELCNIFDYELFKLMKPYSTFINTGRPRQVNDAGLAKALKEDNTRTALIDVVKNDVLTPFNPLYRCKNAYITPHIAGSLSNEIYRMGESMLDEFLLWLDGKDSINEVTSAMLETMA